MLTDPKVRAAYNHSDFMDERRRMMQHWSDFIDGITSGANVSTLRRIA